MTISNEKVTNIYSKLPIQKIKYWSAICIISFIFLKLLSLGTEVKNPDFCYVENDFNFNFEVRGSVDYQRDPVLAHFSAQERNKAVQFAKEQCFIIPK